MNWKDLVSEAHIHEFIKGLDFPCTKQDIIDYAQEHFVPEHVIQLLDKLPDKQYQSYAEVLEAEVISAF